MDILRKDNEITQKRVNLEEEILVNTKKYNIKLVVVGNGGKFTLIIVQFNK